MQTLAFPVLGHPDALVVSAFVADTARHVRGIRPMLEVVTTSCRQSRLQRGRPFFVGLGEPPHLVGGQTKVT
jgi:hypothetical protein